MQCFFICVLLFYACRGILCPYVTHFKFVCALHHAKGDRESVLNQGLQDCGFWQCHSSWSPLKTVLQVYCGAVIGSAFQGWILVCFQEFAKLCIILLFHSGSLDGVQANGYVCFCGIAPYCGSKWLLEGCGVSSRSKCCNQCERQ